jgi:Uma2 family endonuclease
MRRVPQYEGTAMLSNRRPMTEPEFASFLQAHEERWELVDGAPIMMVRTTQRHRDIAANVLAALHVQLRGTGYRPTCARTGVRTGETTIRYPDLVVDCGPRVDQAMCTTAPALVCEVLSSSRDPFDTHLRVSEYRTSRDIVCILLIDPDAPRAILHQRNDAGWHDSL